MDVIFRDEDLNTIIEQSSPCEENENDDGYGFYCELDAYDIENYDIIEREIKYNKKFIDDLIRNEGVNKNVKQFEKKYNLIVDYCMFGLVVFSCSLLLFQPL